MNDVIQRPEFIGQRLGDVMTQHGERRFIIKGFKPLGDAADVIVARDDADRLTLRVGPVPMDDRLDQIVPEKSGSTADVQGPAPQLVELALQTVADVGKIRGDDFGRSLGIPWNARRLND